MSWVGCNGVRVKWGLRLLVNLTKGDHILGTFCFVIYSCDVYMYNTLGGVYRILVRWVVFPSLRAAGGEGAEQLGGCATRTRAGGR